MEFKRKCTSKAKEYDLQSGQTGVETQDPDLSFRPRSRHVGPIRAAHTFLRYAAAAWEMSGSTSASSTASALSWALSEISWSGSAGVTVGPSVQPIRNRNKPATIHRLPTIIFTMFQSSPSLPKGLKWAGHCLFAAVPQKFHRDFAQTPSARRVADVQC